tara:strand:+ start:112 stop:366 length:255 start_codon:yes stop_codon:yes gene_type:complete
LSKPVNVSVKLGGRIRSSEQLIRLFIRKCKKEGIVKEYKDSLVYETKAQKKRRKKKQGAARHRAKQLKEQSKNSKKDRERKYKR